MTQTLTYLTQDGDMLDLICWRQYGQQRGVVELVYKENPELINYNLKLPAGIIIKLPTITKTQATNLQRWWE